MSWPWENSFHKSRAFEFNTVKMANVNITNHHHYLAMIVMWTGLRLSNLIRQTDQQECVIFLSESIQVWVVVKYLMKVMFSEEKKRLTEPLHCEPTCLSAALFSRYLSIFPVQSWSKVTLIAVRLPVIISHLSTQLVYFSCQQTTSLFQTGADWQYTIFIGFVSCVFNHSYMYFTPESRMVPRHSRTKRMIFCWCWNRNKNKETISQHYKTY